MAKKQKVEVKEVEVEVVEVRMDVFRQFTSELQNSQTIPAGFVNQFIASLQKCIDVAADHKKKKEQVYKVKIKTEVPVQEEPKKD